MASLDTSQRLKRAVEARDARNQGKAWLTEQLHANGFTEAMFVDFFKNKVVGEHRKYWIDFLNSLPPKITVINGENGTVTEYSMTAYDGLNNAALLKKLMIAEKAARFLVWEAVAQCLLGGKAPTPPKELWEVSNV